MSTPIHNNPAGATGTLRSPWRAARRRFWVWMAVLTAVFSPPLAHLIRFAAGSDLYSHILLVPLIVVYLVRLKRDELAAAWAEKPDPGSRARGAAVVAAGAAAAAAGWVVWRRSGVVAQDWLSYVMVSFACFTVAAGFCCLGRRIMASLAFPAFFLFFMAPFPAWVTDQVELFLQRASAEVASWIFGLSGATVLRNELVFRLPGITLEVAPECSGIHSSLVLVITSLLAGHLLLNSLWTRTVLVLVVIPLGILRNGFRVFTLGMLCTHIGPHMIDSPIHHRGGPIFFALSLIPFLALLFLLRKWEYRRAKVAAIVLDRPAGKE